MTAQQTKSSPVCIVNAPPAFGVAWLYAERTEGAIANVN